MADDKVQGLSYRDAGVDIDAGNEAVQRIRSLVASTRRPEQVSDLGGFAGMMGLPSGLRDPLLVSCTDGVGTKLLVSIATDRHDTVGIDLVAMSVNDLLVCGAQPLFLLDYIACDRLRPERIEALVAGIAEGCRQSGCALLGGETAELPGMYAEGHYDLAAFAVGVVERDAVLGPERVREGDALLALPSAGLHSNGYSLARKALLDPAHAGLGLDDPLPGGSGETVADALLVPTRIYARAMAACTALPGSPLHAAAHITGGGLIENPPRVLPQGLGIELELAAVPRAPIFRAIAAQGVTEDEMRRTFNCGIGMLLVVAADGVEAVEAALRAVDEPCLRVGRVVGHTDPSRPPVRFTS
ncbi:MAG: phosphoribosylformylglycinamidine cyclo-ligase [Myxococcales bacterium]|nr:phosphoribosylformylglycinamidine cyclo-ligase [Myxococcales bacterium]MCB9713632.1 phosphoribosylformylglycinamidine cyclo-ligase [Myxococcales bacterium]